MKEKTEQAATWLGGFGKEYTDRNVHEPERLDQLYTSNYGVTRSSMNERFLRGIDPSARILEIGSNVGNQLLMLQRMGFRHLYGLELQPYAVEVAKSRTRGIQILEGTAFDIPYKDGFFDLVFTSGVLIHIHPRDLPVARAEIHRATRRHIWGFEYYAPEPTGVEYREHKDLMWKCDFAQGYLAQFPELRLVDEERYRYLHNTNIDAMFLLEKQ